MIETLKSFVLYIVKQNNQIRLYNLLIIKIVFICLFIQFSTELYSSSIKIQNNHVAIIGGKGVVIDGYICGPFRTIDTKSLHLSPNGEKAIFYAWNQKKEVMIVLAYYIKNNINNTSVNNTNNMKLNIGGRWVYQSMIRYGLPYRKPYPVYNKDETELSFVIKKNNGKMKIMTKKQIAPLIVSNKFKKRSSKMSWINKEERERALLTIESGGYDQIWSLMYSPDGKLAYQAKKGKAWFTIIDKKEYGPYDNVKKLIFNLDGTRNVFFGQKNKKWVLVENGKERGEFNEIGRYCFSPKGKKFAYSYRMDSNWTYMVDGEKQGNYATVYAFHFSLDEKRYSYLVRQGKSLDLIVDGRPMGLEYKKIWGPVFSPDSAHIGFIGLKEGKLEIYIDGKKVRSIEGKILKAPVFTPDGNHMLYAIYNENPITSISKRKKYRYYLFANDQKILEVNSFEYRGFYGLFDILKKKNLVLQNRIILCSLPPADIGLMMVKNDSMVFTYYAKIPHSITNGYFHSALVLNNDLDLTIRGKTRKIDIHPFSRKRVAGLRFQRTLRENEYTRLFPKSIPIIKTKNLGTVKHSLKKGNIYFLRKYSDKKKKYYIQNIMERMVNKVFNVK